MLSTAPARLLVCRATHADVLLRWRNCPLRVLVLKWHHHPRRGLPLKFGTTQPSYAQAPLLRAIRSTPTTADDDSDASQGPPHQAPGLHRAIYSERSMRRSYPLPYEAIFGHRGNERHLVV